MISCKTCQYFRGISHEPEKEVMKNTNYPCIQQAMQHLHCSKLYESQLQVKKKCNELGRHYTPSDYFYCSEKSVENVYHGDFTEFAASKNYTCKDYKETHEKRYFDLFGELIK